MRASKIALLLCLAAAGCSRCGATGETGERGIPKDVRKQVESALPVEFRPFTRTVDFEPTIFVDENPAPNTWEHGRIVLEKRGKKQLQLDETRTRFARALDHSGWRPDTVPWTHSVGDYGGAPNQWTDKDLQLINQRNGSVFRLRVWFADDLSKMVVYFDHTPDAPAAK